MFCTCCGQELPDKSEVCPACKSNPRSGENYCRHCGMAIVPPAQVCGCVCEPRQNGKAKRAKG